jgi:hypothetical protein
MNEFLPRTNTNQHELVVRKPFLTFKYHVNKKEHEGLRQIYGVKVRGRTAGTLRVVRGKKFLILLGLKQCAIYIILLLLKDSAIFYRFFNPTEDY